VLREGDAAVDLPDAPTKFPSVLGYEAAGVIDKRSAPAKTERKDGSHVVALAHRYGAHAEVVCVRRTQAFAIPAGHGLTKAAAIPVEDITASKYLFRVARSGRRAACSCTWPRAGLGTAEASHAVCRNPGRTACRDVRHRVGRQARPRCGRKDARPHRYHTTDYAKEI